MALQHGLVVVHLPPYYHCVQNPIELIWSCVVKRHVAEKNTTFKIADVKRLTEEAFAAVPSDLWKSTWRHCEDLVENFWVADNAQDEVAELTIKIDSQEEKDNDGGKEEGGGQ